MDDSVSVAWVDDEYEAAMVQALLKEHGIPSLQMGFDGRVLGEGQLPSGGPRRVMVHRRQAEEARALVEGVQAEFEQAVPDPVNARYLEEAEGRRGPRGHGLIGARARLYLVSFVGMIAISGSYFVLRALGLT